MGRIRAGAHDLHEAYGLQVNHGCIWRIPLEPGHAVRDGGQAEEFMAKVKLLQEGDPVPDVTLTGKGQQPVRLRYLVGQKVLVVYFYPKDESPGCTAQACSLRDQYEDFVAAGAEVVGISGDSVGSHDGFAAKHRLPFVLLSDSTGEARQAFGVAPSLLGLIPGRVTFVVDRAGVIRSVFESQIRVGEHVRRALELVRTLARSDAAGTAAAAK